MNRLTQKLLIQLCLKVILYLGLYTTMQQAYPCLFRNEENKVVNLDYRVHNIMYALYKYARTYNICTDYDL